MKEIIIKNLMDQLDLGRDEITMNSKFVDDFEMDSLDMVEMLIDLEKETDQSRSALAFENQEDAPACHSCGAIMVRNGSCYKCLNCGETSGCS